MYQGSNLSRTGQMAVQNEQVTNQLKLLKAKMSNRDTWQQGGSTQLDSYPHTQPTNPSQSPLYPKSEYDFYSRKEQQIINQTSSLPKINDPRALNYKELQQYKQQMPIQQPQRNDPYLGMNAINRLQYYDQLQKYKQQDDQIKKNNGQSYYEQQQSRRIQQQIQQPQLKNSTYDDIYTKKPYGQQNNYEFQQQKYDYNFGMINNQLNNYNFNYMNSQLQNNQLYHNNQYANNQYGNMLNINNGYSNINTQNYNGMNNGFNNYNQYNNQLQYNNQQQQQQQFKPPQQQLLNQYSHNSQPNFERKNKQYDEQDQQNSNYQQFNQQKPQQQRIQNGNQFQQQKPSYNPIDELPAVAKKNNQQSIPQQDDNEGNLIECPEGCGRSFKQDILDKHIKVCKKVFQSKRKEFNSKAHRQVNQEQPKLEKQGQVKDKIIEKKKQQAQIKGQDPKWKQQSEAFRQMIAAAKTGDQVQQQIIDEMIECPSCGRKFNESAAERHIPGCKKRNFKR